MSEVSAQMPAELVGFWRIVSIAFAGDDRQTGRSEGIGPDGMIIYGSGGFMSAHIVLPARGGNASGSGSVQDQIDAASHHAYFGTYSVDTAARTITHHRLTNNNPGLPADVMRSFHFLGNGHLVLTPSGGRGDQLTFEKVGP